MFITIWRVERKDGIGPYRGIGMSAWTNADHDFSKRTPTPYTAFANGFPGDEYKYAFASPEQLFRWFTRKELSALLAEGYAIVSLKVRPADVIKGDKQVAFIDRRRFKQQTAA